MPSPIHECLDDSGNKSVINLRYVLTVCLTESGRGIVRMMNGNVMLSDAEVRLTESLKVYWAGQGPKPRGTK